VFSIIDTNNVLLLNQLANSSNIWRDLSLFLSSYLIYFIPLVPIISIFMTKNSVERSNQARVFVWAMTAIIFSLAVGYLFEGAIGRNRPYLALSEIQPIGHIPGNTSFPSMHSLIVFAFALTYVLKEKYFQMGLFLFLLALLVATGRMLCGLHYPTDLIGGFVIGTFSALILAHEGSPFFKWLGKRVVNSEQ
jgi:undecaprenyl-diphosphatase